MLKLYFGKTSCLNIYFLLLSENFQDLRQTYPSNIIN